jgi:cytochrome c oxidase cbb3-type subunit 2
VLFAAPFLVTLLGWGMAAAVYFNGVLTRESAPAATAPLPDGGRLYTLNCANCHGDRGDGSGTTRLDPKARSFGEDKFKFATTTNGIPTDDDLRRIVRRGIPGSAMPAFPQFSDEELAAVIGHVRVFTRNGLYERLYKKAKKEAEESGDDFKPAELRRKVDALAGQPLDIPKAFADLTGESIARGQLVFTREGCVKCHGAKGHGDGEQTKDPKFLNDDGSPARPRDLTLGLYKGGGDKEHLYARVLLGIPGTPMPAASATLRGRDVEDLLNYVKSLAQTPVAAAPAVTTSTVGPK